MISKNRFKYLQSLKIKKYRNKASQILIEGLRLVGECVDAGASIECIYCTQSFYDKTSNYNFINLLDNKKILVEKINDNDMNNLSESINHQGVVGVVNINTASKISMEDKHQLILDSISDPGNLGNIIRTADWFGLKNIYLSDNSVDPFNSKVVRSAMGAHFYVNIFMLNIVEHIIELKKNNFTIVVADMLGDSIYNWDVPDKWAIILGNEAHGVSDKLRKLVDYNIAIPKKGNIESLNVSTAAGIILSKVRKL